VGHGDGTFSLEVTFPSVGDSPSGFLVRALNSDSRHDIVLTDNLDGTLVKIKTNTATNCTPPGSGSVSVNICTPTTGSTRSSPFTVKAAGNAPAGIKRMELFVDGLKRFQTYNDQLRTSLSLGAGTHRIAVVSVDLYDATAKKVVFVTVP
jgi:hypothetical protein